MKKMIYLFIVAYFLLLTSNFSVFAQEEEITPTSVKRKATASPTPEEEGKETKSKIDAIKEKIASTVAQLNLVSKKGVIGEITKIEKNQLTLEKDSDVQLVDIDELTTYTKVTGKKRTDIEFSDLNVSDRIVVIGLYNRESRRLLARILLVKNVPLAIAGAVREVDIKGGTVTLEDKKQTRSVTVDIEKATQISSYTKTEGVVKSGLSKIEIGQRTHVFGQKNTDEKDRITATRILLLPPKTIGSTPTPVEVKKENTPTPTAAKPTSSPRPTRKPSPVPTDETQ